MGVIEAAGDPDDDPCVQSGEVRQHLAEVLQVRFFELVLDDHPAVVHPGAGHNVGAIGADVHFGVLLLQLNSKLARETIQVLGQPRSEVLGFVLPRVAEIGCFQCSQCCFLCCHGELYPSRFPVSPFRITK